MTQLPLLIILLIFSALFSGSETALFSLSKLQIKRIGARRPGIGRTITELLEHPRRTLTAILVGNMLANITASGILTAFMIEAFGRKGIGMSIGAMAFFLLIFGELTPKSFAIRNAEPFSVLVARPLHWFAGFIYPIRRVLRLITDFFYFSIVGRKKAPEPFITQGELETLVSIGEKEGIVGREERHMIQTVFDLGRRSVEEIMVPRVDIVSVGNKAPRHDLERIIEGSKHTKIPVYGASIDEIIGIVYTKEFMLDKKEDWAPFIRPALFVPQTKRIDELMVEFQTRKIYMAIAVDEHGGTAGLVTMDDILEEIVGEMRDEYDKDEGLFQETAPGVIKVSGRMSLHDLSEQLGIDIQADGPETVGGFIMQLLERIPKAGDTARFKNMTLTVDKVGKNRIEQATIKKQ